MKKWDKPSEFTEALNKVYTENKNLESLKYFTDLAYRWYHRIRNGKSESKVIVLGTGIPRELIMAAGIRPFYILGGSHEASAGSDELVPRDTDPVSRSILGYLYSCGIENFRDRLFLISTATDSMRKIAGQLRRDGMQVFTMDIPPVRSDAEVRKKWMTQMIRMTDAVCAFTNSTISTNALYHAMSITAAAGREMASFLKNASEPDSPLNASGRLLVQNSYYYADDLKEWTAHLHALGREMQRKSVITSTCMTNIQMKELPEKGEASDQPGVLLMGSPVYFPNDKIPRLLTESGLGIRQILDTSVIECTGRQRVWKYRSKRKMVERIARIQYRNDGSSAYTRNEVLREHVREIIRTGRIEGVVFHILKGHIEPDFELTMMEELFEQANVPVFRLETDYQYQDVEQLRIRMEAFREMLVQNRYRKEQINNADKSILLNSQMLRKIRQKEEREAV